MILRLSFTLARLVAAALLLELCGGCAPLQVAHVPPGQSLNVALAKKPEVLQLPPSPTAGVAALPQPGLPLAGAAVEPELPKIDTGSRTAEAFSRGEFCMSSGHDDEAIQAFQEVVKIDPGNSEAWQQLATLYEKKGDNKKAIEAFRRSKKLASG